MVWNFDSLESQIFTEPYVMKLHHILFVCVVCLPLIFASSTVRAWSPLDSLEQGYKAFQGCDWRVITETEEVIPQEDAEEEEEPDCE